MLDMIAFASKRPLAFGKMIFVMKSTDTDNYDRITNMITPDNEGRVRVFGNVTDALTYAQDNDTIFVGPGVYTEADELVISQANLKLIGSNTSGICWGPCSLKATANHIISVQANGVEIYGLGFIQNGAYRGIEIDHTAAVYKTHIHGCHFGGSATATYGVYAGGTFDAVDTVIENNEFLSWATAGIYMNATRSKARNNLIFVPASGIGIQYVPTGSDRGFNQVSYNEIAGANSSDTGIQIDGTPSAGQLTLCHNYVSGCATKITQTANGDLYGMENYASTAAGGALIDIDT
ncbi:MAG: hypothetical protein WC332_02765 [Clostridia bacterium]